MNENDYIIGLDILAMATMRVTDVVGDNIFAKIQLPDSGGEVIVDYPKNDYYHILDGKIAVSQKPFKVGDPVISRNVINENVLRVLGFIEDPPKTDYQEYGLEEGYVAGDICCLFIDKSDDFQNGLILSHIFYKPDQVQNVSFLSFIQERMSEATAFEQQVASEQIQIKRIDSSQSPDDIIDDITGFIEDVIKKENEKRRNSE